MGVKPAVLESLRGAAPNAWRSRIDPKVGYSVFSIDVFSIMFSLIGGCATVKTLRAHLRTMFAQHRACASTPTTSIYTIFAFEDYKRTPPTKQIVRDSRSESSTALPYTDVQLACEFGPQNEEIFLGPKTVDVGAYEFSHDVNLPKDFARVRCTPSLMRKFTFYLCGVIEEESIELLRSDPQHFVIIDGYRDWRRRAATGEENEVFGAWFSQTGKMESKNNVLGEGEVKAVFWAAYAFADGGNNAPPWVPRVANANALVHANDGDIVALLAFFSMRNRHARVITGAMCTSYFLPIEGASSHDKETMKIFNSLELVTGVWQSINTRPEQVRMLPQTFFYFLFMCGNDFIDQLPQVGPAKFAALVTNRDDKLLKDAVLFENHKESRVRILVDERAILTALVSLHGGLLKAQSISSQHLAGWIRRVTWTTDYYVNLKFIDPFERLEGKSVHGYKKDESGKCLPDDDVWQPTLVEITVPAPSPKISRKQSLKTKRIENDDEVVIASALDDESTNAAKRAKKDAVEPTTPSLPSQSVIPSIHGAFSLKIDTSPPVSSVQPPVKMSIHDFFYSPYYGSTEARRAAVLLQQGTIPFGETPETK